MFEDLINFLNDIVNIVTVVHTARKSAIGSANSTAKTLSSRNIGNINIRGINSITFLNMAKKADILAFPKATNVC